MRYDKEWEWELHDTYIDFITLLDEREKTRDIFTVHAKRANRLIIGFKNIYKEANNISEFECARIIKGIKDRKNLYDNELKRLNGSVARIEEFNLLYEDI